MTGERLFFIDRLRVVLTALVILHHTAITYGGSGGWFYREVTDGGTPTSLLFTVFCAINQSFFMGMFFLLAAYFAPASLLRRGFAPYLADRLVRLGVPLLVFGFVVGPLTVALAGAPRGIDPSERWLALLSQGRFVIGPLWFAWALLIFAAALAAWRQLRPQPASDIECALPRSRTWLFAAVAVGAVALAIRQIVPVGETVLGLQLGYFASYAFLFALGCIAARSRWLERLEARQARAWGRVSLASAPMLFVAAASGGALEGREVNYSGNLGWPAVIYAFWEPFMAWGVIATLLVVFRERFDTPSPAWQRWSRQAYGAFILHAPVVVALSVSMAGWRAPPALKFVLVGTLGTIGSFMAAAVLLRMPGAQRVV